MGREAHSSRAVLKSSAERVAGTLLGQLIVEQHKNVKKGYGFAQKLGWRLDRVSTGSDSDLVSDQHGDIPDDFNYYGSTRSLPLPVLTRSKRDRDF